jgi:hypothetical protein
MHSLFQSQNHILMRFHIMHSLFQSQNHILMRFHPAGPLVDFFVSVEPAPSILLCEGIRSR